jgi:hypothetical protein
MNAATRVLSQSGLEHIAIHAAEQGQASDWMDVPVTTCNLPEIVTEISTQPLPVIKSVRKKSRVSPFQQEFVFPVS